MIKTEAIVQLLAELESEPTSHDVGVLAHSEAVIYLSKAPNDGIRLTGPECQLLFANEDTVSRLRDAVDDSEASLALFDITIGADIQDALERSFAAVDEG